MRNPHAAEYSPLDRSPFLNAEMLLVANGHRRHFDLGNLNHFPL